MSQSINQRTYYIQSSSRIFRIQPRTCTRREYLHVLANEQASIDVTNQSEIYLQFMYYFSFLRFSRKFQEFYRVDWVSHSVNIFSAVLKQKYPSDNQYLTMATNYIILFSNPVPDFVCFIYLIYVWKRAKRKSTLIVYLEVSIFKKIR